MNKIVFPITVVDYINIGLDLEKIQKELLDNLFNDDLITMLKFVPFKIGRYTKNLNLQLQLIIHLYSVKMVENLQIHQKEYTKMEWIL